MFIYVLIFPSHSLLWAVQVYVVVVFSIQVGFSVLFDYVVVFPQRRC